VPPVVACFAPPNTSSSLLRVGGEAWWGDEAGSSARRGSSLLEWKKYPMHTLTVLISFKGYSVSL
jgi:hypothetical protein